MMEVPGDGDGPPRGPHLSVVSQVRFISCIEFHLELAGTHLVRPVASQARFIVAGRQPPLAALHVTQSPFDTRLLGAVVNHLPGSNGGRVLAA